ncbi:MAG: MMPL family transporter [Thermoanaerobaculia bacterium]|nr:MMPL family transporter [Thermoanaerobaculia bacterium]
MSCLLLASGAGLTARHLRLEPSIALLSRQDAVVRLDAERQALFGADLRLLVALHRPADQGGVLRADALEQLRRLHDALTRVPGVTAVASLVDATLLAVAPSTASWDPGAPSVPPQVGQALLDPDTRDDPSRLRRRLNGSPVQRAMLLSQRESLTPLYLQLAAEADEPAVVAAASALAQDLETRYPAAGSILVVGPAVVETGLASHILEDMKRLVPLALVLVVGGLWLALRRSVFLAVVALHALALEALTLGAMVAAGYSVNLVSVLAPVLLVPIGAADLLHLCIWLRADRGPPEDARERLAQAFRCLERPMVVTTATTVVGFLGFLLSPVAALRDFGLVLAGGSLLALVLTFTLDAAFLSLAWRPSAGPERRPSQGRLERWLLALDRPGVARRQTRLVGVLALAAAGLAAVVVPRLAVEDTWIRNFDPGSRVLRDARAFEREFFGTNTLAVVFTSDAALPGSLEAMLEAVNRFTTEHTVDLGARGLLSPTLLVRALDPAQGFPWTPWPTPSPAAMAAGLDGWRRRGPALPRAESLATPDLRRSQVQLFVRNQPYRQLVATQDRLVQDARAVAGPGVTVAASGNLAVNIRMVEQAVTSQLVSLVGLFVVVSAVMIAVVGAAGRGLLLMAPLVLALLGTFTALVLVGWPFGVAVSMFPTLVIGLAVDFSTHLWAAHQLPANSRGRRARALATAIRGVLWNGLLWSVGFGLLGISALPPNRHLGLLCALVLVSSTVWTLALVPALALTAGTSPAVAALTPGRLPTDRPRGRRCRGTRSSTPPPARRG